MNLELIVDIIASIIGLVSIGLLLGLNRKIGGRISGALRWFVAGIVCMILAFIWSAIFGHGIDMVNTANNMHMTMTTISFGFQPTIDIHHLLMTIGMIFFILSAQRFSSLVSNN